MIFMLVAMFTMPHAFGHDDPCPKGDGKATNIIYRVNGAIVPQLKGYVKPNSEVSVTFTVVGTTATYFSLASYKTPDTMFSMAYVGFQEVYTQATRRCLPGTYTLKVRVPDCFFEVVFVKGCVIEHLDADCEMTYQHQDRLIASAEGGTHRCSKKDDEVVNPPKKDTICHINPATGEQTTIVVDEDVADEHMQHHDYAGVCRPDSQPPVDTTAQCPCDYDNDGKIDRIYGGHYMDFSGLYMAKFSGGSDSVLVSSQSETLFYVDVYFEDGTLQSYTNLNVKTKWFIFPGQNVIAVDVNGNFIENLHLIDPEFQCDCIDEPGEAVPVKMTKFTAKKIEANQVLLEWTTAQEINSDYISIEKSIDINTWEEVCRVATTPGGNSNTRKDYSCVDTRAQVSGNNLVYYRPKQVDLNGAYEYHNTIKLRLSDAEYATTVGNAYPNPATDRIHFRYNTSDNGLFAIRLLSIEGKVLLSQQFAAKPGQQVVDIDLPENNLKSGFYILEIQNEGQTFRQKVYKK